MKNLEQIIIGKGEVRGFVFTQIQKSDKAYIYRVDSGASIYYQVFKTTHKTNSKRHCFPTSKAFGIWAWAYISLDKANEKFNELNKAE